MFSGHSCNRIVFLQCRYDKLNERALRDVELYDRTGRVRSPSPVELTASEEDIEATCINENARCNKRIQHAFEEQQVVATTGEEDILSGSTAEEDGDTDFHPSESEGDSTTTVDLSSSENGSEEEDEGFVTPEDPGKQSTGDDAYKHSSQNKAEAEDGVVNRTRSHTRKLKVSYAILIRPILHPERYNCCSF